MTTALPSNVSYGYVSGRLIYAVADSADAGIEPDAVAATGTVTFTPTPSSLIDASVGIIILPRPIIVDLDSNGSFLVLLVATNDVDLNPVNWTYTVTFQLAIEVAPFSMPVLANTTIDLSNIIPAASTPGTVVVTGPAGPSAYQSALNTGFVGTEAQWIVSITGLPGPPGNPMSQGSFQAPTVTNSVPTVTIASNWGINLGVASYNPLGSPTAQASIMHLLNSGVVGLRRIGDPDTTLVTEANDWVTTASYTHGQVVTHLGSRWYARINNTNNPPSRENASWLFLGFRAIISETDPGGGMMYFRTSDDGGPPTDTTPPSTPTGLAATTVSFEQINLAWAASTDNVGVVSYRIRRDGLLIATVFNPALTFQDFGLSASTTYSYTVAARDGAGNESGLSAAAVATTLTQSSGGVDTTPPSVPTGLTATAGSFTAINLAWSASTDNVGVVSYRVRRGGVLIATIASTNYQDTGLIANTTYSYTVAAVDAATNQSGLSGVASATTLGQGGTSLDGGSFATAGTGNADGGSFAVAGTSSYDGGGF